MHLIGQGALWRQRVLCLLLCLQGAGHMVPETNPEEALVMFERFLHFRQL